MKRRNFLKLIVLAPVAGAAVVYLPAAPKARTALEKAFACLDEPRNRILRQIRDFHEMPNGDFVGPLPQEFVDEHYWVPALLLDERTARPNEWVKVKLGEIP